MTINISLGWYDWPGDNRRMVILVVVGLTVFQFS
jgi:hypothetical protein